MISFLFQYFDCSNDVTYIDDDGIFPECSVNNCERTPERIFSTDPNDYLVCPSVIRLKNPAEKK